MAVICLLTFHIFVSSPEALGQFQPNLANANGIQIYSNEGPHPFSRGDNFEIVKILALTKIIKSSDNQLTTKLGTKLPWVNGIQL